MVDKPSWGRTEITIVFFLEPSSVAFRRVVSYCDPVETFQIYAKVSSPAAIAMNIAFVSDEPA
jgi:hypothetical protein